MDHYELTKYITSSTPNNELSKITQIESCIHEEKWEIARSKIKEMLDVQPKKLICLLMAKIEKGDSNDIQKADSWILRSKNGKESYMWVCSISEKNQQFWSSVSLAGHFNSLEWRQPKILVLISS